MVMADARAPHCYEMFSGSNSAVVRRRGWPSRPCWRSRAAWPGPSRQSRASNRCSWSLPWGSPRAGIPPTLFGSDGSQCLLMLDNGCFAGLTRRSGNLRQSDRATRTSLVPQRLHQLRHSPSTRCALDFDRRWPTTEQTIRQINARLLWFTAERGVYAGTVMNMSIDVRN